MDKEENHGTIIVGTITDIGTDEDGTTEIIIARQLDESMVRESVVKKFAEFLYENIVVTIEVHRGDKK